MNYLAAKSKIKGPLNPLATLGMLGDLAVLGLLYGYWRYRKACKAEAAPKLKEQAKIQAM